MNKYRKIIILSLKIGAGSCLAMYTAQLLGLEYPVSAGTIALLTLLTSKWETVKLSVCRLATFTMTVLIAWQVFLHIESTWIAYGILLSITVFIAEVFGWRATISVNGVIAAHLVTNHDFSDGAIWNEFLLVLIGIGFAVVFNLFHGNIGHKRYITGKMEAVEKRLQLIIGALAAYLSNKEMERNVWMDLRTLEEDIQKNIKEAQEYQDNTFSSHPEYYISYFEMRYSQCKILHNLHEEMRKIRTMPTQAKTVAEYMLYLCDFVKEHNHPQEQLEQLEYIFRKMEDEELPKTREEFVSRALLYHVLMDIEDFLTCKIRFIKGLSEDQRKIYWND